MNKLTVAICPDGYAGVGNSRDSDCSSDKWISILKAKGHKVKIVDVNSPYLFDELKGVDAFMWRWAHLSNMRDIALRIFPVIENYLKIPCFPNLSTCWHYDDKIAQAYLLKSNNIPIPKTWVWYDYDSLSEWVENEATYPLVLKLYNGAGSKNVKLIKTSTNLLDWAKRLFSHGVFDLSEESLFKIENFSLGYYLRLRAALKTLKNGRAFFGQKVSVNPKNSFAFHKNYLLVQEFLPGNEFDTRVTVIGNRAFAFRRFNRPNDFRASGSGNIDFEYQNIDVRFVEMAFEVAKKLQMQSCAIDGLYKNSEPIICEISYTFANWAVHNCPGHWEYDVDGTLIWKEGQMWPEVAQLEDFLESIDQQEQK